MARTTLGLLVGTRGFFPVELSRQGREDMLKILQANGFEVITLAPEETPHGTVESYRDAQACAALFQRHAARLDGIVVTLPNFGDERGVADALRLAGLRVPVLVHAWPDDATRMTIAHRRDSFCGKLSVCNNLRQYGIPFSLTRRHTVDPHSPAFARDLADFGVTCRVVRGLRHARIGAIGARPAAFNTVRYSEKLLEASGISVVTMDLFDLFGRVTKLADSDPTVQQKLAAIQTYVLTLGVPAAAVLKMAKLGTVIDAWIAQEGLAATAIQCWTAMEEYFGVVPCTIMSMLSNNLSPSACEVDVTGAVGMLAMSKASGQPSALLDWNNNYGDDPDACVLFHCSNLPKAVMQDLQMDSHAILAGAVGKENTYGTCTGCMKTGPFTYCRVSTDEATGRIRTYLGQGAIEKQPLATFGGVGVARIPQLQALLQYLCRHGFEHHVAMNPVPMADGLREAFSTYLGWDVYHHQP